MKSCRVDLNQCARSPSDTHQSKSDVLYLVYAHENPEISSFVNITKSKLADERGRVTAALSNEARTFGQETPISVQSDMPRTRSV